MSRRRELECRFDSHHEIKYLMDREPMAAWTAESLIGIERLALRTPFVLAQALGGLPVPRVEVYVCTIQAGSLKDKIFLRYIWGSEDEMNKWLDRLRELTGVSRLNNQLPTLGPVLMLLVVFGGTYAAMRMAGVNGAGERINIDRCSNSIINVGAGQLNMTPDQCARLIREYSGNQFNVASNACKVLRPARESDCAVMMDQDQALVIPKEAVKEVPPGIDRSVEPASVAHLVNEAVHIRALDRDSQKHGWAVVVPSVSGKRLRMELDPAVDRTSLTGATIKADIDLYYDTNDDGDRIYKAAYLKGVR